MRRLAICYCQEGTPEHLHDARAAELYCQRAEEIAELWATASNAQDSPDEAQILVPFSTSPQPRQMGSSDSRSVQEKNS